MMPDNLQLIEAITKSAGLAAGILACVCLLMYRMYASERKDRREAWKAHNELARETNTVITNLTLVLEAIKLELNGGK